MQGWCPGWGFRNLVNEWFGLLRGARNPTSTILLENASENAQCSAHRHSAAPVARSAQIMSKDVVYCQIIIVSVAVLQCC